MHPTTGCLSARSGRLFFVLSFCLISLLTYTACQRNTTPDSAQNETEFHDHEHEDGEYPPEFADLFGCTKANSQQISIIDQGNTKRDRFLSRCRAETGQSDWCDQLTRPNPQSISAFRCTYGSTQPHQLIHPNENTWSNAIRAVKIIQQLTSQGLRICQIYNWWRPEPYNKNVGGAAGRHPFGTAVDVRFCSDNEAVRGFSALCKLRKQGLLRAIGYYGSSGVHFGIADSLANTWGKSCP